MQVLETFGSDAPQVDVADDNETNEEQELAAA